MELTMRGFGTQEANLRVKNVSTRGEIPVSRKKVQEEKKRIGKKPERKNPEEKKTIENKPNRKKTRGNKPKRK